MGKSEKLSQQWKTRLAYTDGLAGTKFHNLWRTFKFTIKGKKIGCSPEWNSFLAFKEDMYPKYTEGMSLFRKDKTKPFSADNCYLEFWENYTPHTAIKLTYDGETRTLAEWCLHCELNYNGVRQRYHKGKNYTTEEILFGKKARPRRECKNWSDNRPANRIKASKMICQYKLTDKKKGFVGFDLDIDWFLDNIAAKKCVYCGSSERIGADRVNNCEGHTKNNIVPCCYRCNSTRGDKFTYEEMKKLGRFIAENIDCVRAQAGSNAAEGIKS